MKREYTITYQCSNDDGKVSQWVSFASLNSFHDKVENLIQEYEADHQNDINFAIINVSEKIDGDIDMDLINRMRAIRDMCELGHKVRAEAKIRNRQPLDTAYVLFSNKQIHNYMVYVDCKNNSYANVLGEELNVMNVVFIEDANQFTEVILKPNFRSLGKKGFGKEANSLKEVFKKMSFDDRKAIHSRLENKEAININGIDLTSADIDIEFMPKAGYASASSKSGVVILDTSLTKELLEKGFIADLKSAMQNMRRDLNLELTDRVSIEVCCKPSEANLIHKNKEKLQKELLANEIVLLPDDWQNKSAKKIEINGIVCYIEIKKV